MSFIIAGYPDQASYSADESSWDGDTVYDTKDEAHEAAVEWISEQNEDACAEIIELSESGSEGTVRRILTSAGWQDLLYPGEETE